jgi:hypothetical protein
VGDRVENYSESPSRSVFGLFSIVSGLSALVLSAQMRQTHATAEQLMGSTAERPPSRP